MNDRLQSLQALRGLAVLLVIGVHLRHFSSRWLPAGALPDWSVHLQSGVDLFFVISGYVMVYVTCRPGRPQMRAPDFMIRRLLRILPLYWLFTLLIAAVWFVAPGFMQNRGDSWTSTLIGSLALWPQSSFPLVGQGWSLVHEMYFYLVFAVLLAAVGSRLAIGLIVWTGLVIGGLAICGPFDDGLTPWLRTVFHPLTLEFVGGAAVALFHRAGHSPGPMVSLQIGLAFWMGSLFQPELERHGLLRAFWHGGAAVLIVHGLVTLERTRRFVPPTWLIAVGEASYSIYLSHLLVIVALGRSWIALAGAPSGKAGIYAMLVALAAAALVAGFLVWRYAEKPLQAACSRLVHRNPTSPSATTAA